MRENGCAEREIERGRGRERFRDSPEVQRTQPLFALFYGCCVPTSSYLWCPAALVDPVTPKQETGGRRHYSLRG